MGTKTVFCFKSFKKIKIFDKKGGKNSRLMFKENVMLYYKR